MLLQLGDKISSHNDVVLGNKYTSTEKQFLKALKKKIFRLFYFLK